MPASADVAILDATTGDVVDSASTDGTGCATLTIPGQAAYDIRITIGSVVGYIRSFTLGCGSTPTFTPNCCVLVNVAGCGGPLACGADVTISHPATGDVLATGVTDASGAVIIPLWWIPSPRTISGTATAQATDLGYATSDAATLGLPAVCNYPPTSTNTLDLALNIDPDYVCFSGANLPIPRHLTLTDANGSHAFDYCEPSGGTAGWYACDAPTVAGTIQYDEYCQEQQPSTSPCPVGYFGAPATDGTNYTFDVTRSWRLYRANVGGHLTAGYAGLDWDQFGTGLQLPGCTTDADGCNVIDTASGGCPVCADGGDAASSDGSATYDPCSPFAASIASLTFNGTGLTHTGCGPDVVPGDPVGGGVTIS